MVTDHNPSFQSAKTILRILETTSEGMAKYSNWQINLLVSYLLHKFLLNGFTSLLNLHIHLLHREESGTFIEWLVNQV